MHEGVVSKISVNKEEDFEGWETWKEKQKQGVDCRVMIRIRDNTVTVHTYNEGVRLKDVTRIDTPTPKIYAALSGDQCALTGIKIRRGAEQQ